MILCDLVTVFAETKSVTKSKLHCNQIGAKLHISNEHGIAPNGAYEGESDLHFFCKTIEY